MKYIVKGQEPHSFTEWKALSNENWQPTYDNLSSDVKRDVKDALINEQGGICCYCEVKLAYADSHIEHLDPQTNNEAKRLDFQNMLCSCQKLLEKGEPRHCGNSKGSWYDDVLLVSPLDPKCEKKFTYTADGCIGFTDEASQETIKHLKLDIDKLNILRANAIEPFIIDPITFEVISKEDAKKFAEKYVQKTDKKYNEFYTTIQYLFLNDNTLCGLIVNETLF